MHPKMQFNKPHHNMAPSNPPFRSFHNPFTAISVPDFGSRIANPLFRPMAYTLTHFPLENNLESVVNLPGSSAEHPPSSPGITHLRSPSAEKHWGPSVLVQGISPLRVLNQTALQAKYPGQDDKVQQDIDRNVTKNYIPPNPPSNFHFHDGSFVRSADMNSVFSNKRSLNVESPAFTPATLPLPRATTISSQAANAAPFTPRAITSGEYPYQ